MVFGFSMQPTYVPSVSQWAEITIMAWGLGSRFPQALRLLVKSLSRMMFNGEPWPMNKVGIFLFIVYLSS
jgi:hypothetical protein